MTVELTYHSASLLRELVDTALAGRGTGNKYRDDALRLARESLERAMRDTVLDEQRA